MRSTSKYVVSDTREAETVDVGRERKLAALVDDEVAACRLLAFRDDCAESEILQDCHRRLMTGGMVSWREADRVVAAVARQLEWTAPAWPQSA